MSWVWYWYEETLNWIFYLKFTFYVNTCIVWTFTLNLFNVSRMTFKLFLICRSILNLICFRVDFVTIRLFLFFIYQLNLSISIRHFRKLEKFFFCSFSSLSSICSSLLCKYSKALAECRRLLSMSIVDCTNVREYGDKKCVFVYQLKFHYTKFVLGGLIFIANVYMKKFVWFSSNVLFTYHMTSDYLSWYRIECMWNF